MVNSLFWIFNLLMFCTQLLLHSDVYSLVNYSTIRCYYFETILSKKILIIIRRHCIVQHFPCLILNFFMCSPPPEESENKVEQLNDRVAYYNYFNRSSRPAFRRSSSTNSHNYVINSNNNYVTKTDQQNNDAVHSKIKEDSLSVASELIEIANRRSPSPPKFYNKSKSPFDFPDNRTDSSKTHNPYIGPSNAYNTKPNNVYNSGPSNAYNSGPTNAYNSGPSNAYNSGPSYNTANSPLNFPRPSAYNFNKPATNGPLTAPARLDEKEKYFLPFTFPEQFPYKIPSGMTTNGGTSPSPAPPTSSRRFSEENGFRRPLGESLEFV